MVKGFKIIQRTLTFLILVFLPFGQLLGVNFNFIDLRISFLFLDVLVFAFVLISLPNFLKRKVKSKSFLFTNFLTILIFSFLYSFFIFGELKLLLPGFFYLVRIVVYVFFLNFLADFFIRIKEERNFYFDALLVVFLFFLIFGFIQYFLYPDFRAFLEWGWDEHYYRLLGTFLDPNYTGLVLVFGFFFYLLRFQRTKNVILALILPFFFFGILLTYSRSTYLAFISGLFYLLIKERKKFFLLSSLFFILFILCLFFLPNKGGEGANLLRSASVMARLESYTDGFKIFLKNPIFGAGYNNICIAKYVFLNKKEFLSHSCSGLDSSLLLVFAATGLLGFFAFFYDIYFVFKMIRSDEDLNFLLFFSFLIFIHSLFVNSFFYAPILIIYFYLMAFFISNTENKKV